MGRLSISLKVLWDSTALVLVTSPGAGIVMAEVARASEREVMTRENNIGVC